MSVIYTDIRLENPIDAGMAIRGLLDASEVRSVAVNALVDTGAWNLVINEKTRAALGLNILYEDTAELANGVKEKCGVTEPVTVHWRDRKSACMAYVLPGSEDAILGAYPMEGLDLTINPKREVIGKHGDKIFMFIY